MKISFPLLPFYASKSLFLNIQFKLSNYLSTPKAVGGDPVKIHKFHGAHTDLH
jgi:hypothetical protein